MHRPDKLVYDEGERGPMREIIAVCVNNTHNILVSVPHYFSDDDVNELLEGAYVVAVEAC